MRECCDEAQVMAEKEKAHLRRCGCHAPEYANRIRCPGKLPRSGSCRHGKSPARITSHDPCEVSVPQYLLQSYSTSVISGNCKSRNVDTPVQVATRILSFHSAITRGLAPLKTMECKVGTLQRMIPTIHCATPYHYRATYAALRESSRKY